MNYFKKTTFLFVISIILILSACSNNEDQSLIKNSLFEDTERILVYKDTSYIDSIEGEEIELGSFDDLFFIENRD
ncbi:MAG: hypothetical protein ACTH0B_06495 [Senegalia sp. (in: firmicutes)]